MKFLEVRVAQYEAVLRVPNHEGFGDGLDGVAQPQVRFDGALHQGLLFGDVDGDADEMWTPFAGLLDQLAARAQPHPVAVRMAHTEGVVDQGGGGVGELGGKLIEMDILGMDEGVDLPEAQ